MLCTRFTRFSHVTACPAFPRNLNRNHPQHLLLPFNPSSRSFGKASSGMASSTASSSFDEHETNEKMKDPSTIPNRLILCFDGTGNSFQANTQDTNIVKLYDKFNRDAPHQMHYYQPGIGTYTSDGKAVSSSWLGKLKSSFSKTIDEGLATSFESHVCSGYRFLMRYYRSGDRIYIFGFSRGAFTARFLARMVSEVGLLSMGNEELVPFAYQKYQEYALGQYTAHIDRSVAEPTEQQKREHTRYLEQKQYLNNFKITFCRHEGDHKHDSKHDSKQVQCGIKPHFLGLFDTVSSVGTLDVPFTSTIKLSQVGGTAEHIRHAVAIDEHRVKFKVALLEQDIIDGNVKEDVKEVWFPGNHGDVGGGWSATKNAEKEGPTEHVEEDRYQLSDIALKWMIEELDDLPGDKPEWNHRRDVFMDQFDYEGVKYEEAIKAPIHNTMSLKDSSWYKVLMWWLMEYFPLIKRWEYYWDKNGTKGHWKYVAFPPNMGGGRDIPPDANFHRSVLDRMKKGDPKYEPTNDVFIKDTAGNVKSRDSDKLCKVVPPGGNESAISEQRLRHLEFKQVGESKRDKDLYYIERK